jgi:tetratricopeptide (TPR) repeat protein
VIICFTDLVLWLSLNYGRSLTISERQLGAEHPAVATSLNNLALLYQSQGRYAEAEPLLLRSLAILEQRLGVNHPHTVTVRGNLQQLREEMKE